MNYVLLLTATIFPKHVNLLNGRNDPIERENDYFGAVSFYLSQGFTVVFVDNSNTFSKKILSLKTKFDKFEYHSFESVASHLGKSPGEVEIIKYACENSTFIKEVDYIVKVTGRYIIRNLLNLLSKTNYIEADIYINPTRNLKWADSRLMIMKKKYYENYFLKAIDLFLDEDKLVFMEHAYMKSLFLYLIDGGELNLLPSYPFYHGYDGTHNEKIYFSIFKRLKYFVYYKLKRFSFRHRA
ncbi:hypothetical protein CLV31_11583 [Algoriphagus aquaeductus]|uniref:Uncharacterized protein n=1 Tax=Algoriphagus aquaeductus TaxID=475299 RepID=A0A326RPB1_9BACT|nr:hypothetical protein [Algoriphagus aquaeductus]PZV79123.1 hypothetical protein CLV31_11583 [Algoriphagus aquaeductus]